MARWLIAGVALGLGGTVTACLLIFANPSRDAIEVFVAARDVASGTELGSESIALTSMHVEHRELVFTRRDASALAVLRTTHDLLAGQLIQRSDVTVPEAPAADARLVFIPIKDVPALVSGAKVDLLAVDSSSGQVSVQPFALGVEVRESTSSGLVVAVSPRQAAAFVYATQAMHLVAVVAEPAGTSGAEVPVSSAEQAMEIAGQP